MCIDIASGSRTPYGFLYKNDLNEFVYSCSRCDEEFRVGHDLEHHSIGHDVKQENEIDVDPDLTLHSEAVEVYPPHFLPNENVKNETISVDSSRTEEMAVYLPFETQKLEVNIVEQPPKPDPTTSSTTSAVPISLTEPHESIDDDFPAFGSENDSSSDDGDFFAPTTKKKTTKKGSKEKSKKNSPKKVVLHCDICSRLFTSLARIKQHMTAVHINKKERALCSPELCTLCGKQIRNMKTHVKLYHSSEKPFKCDHCEATFRKKVHRDTHVRHHTGEKPFICHLCGRSFYADNVLTAHINQYHLNLKPHKCDQCGNAYRQLYQLRDHINLHHLNQKMYPCEVCERRFGTRKHLKQHMLSHGEKRFQCKFCEQKFATGSGRRGHEIRNHEKV